MSFTKDLSKRKWKRFRYLVVLEWRNLGDYEIRAGFDIQQDALDYAESAISEIRPANRRYYDYAILDTIRQRYVTPPPPPAPPVNEEEWLQTMSM